MNVMILTRKEMDEDEFDDIDTTKPRIIEIENMGDEVGQFLWDGSKMTMQIYGRDDFSKNFMNSTFTEASFLNTFTDSYCEDDGTEDYLAFLSKTISKCMLYGLSHKVIEK
jgi:hypothetical protein